MCQNKSPASPLSPTLDVIIHNYPKVITYINHVSSLPDATQVSDRIMSSVITIDNNINEQVSSFDFNSPKVQFNISNSSSSQSAIITDSKTNYYENSHKGQLIYIVQSADKAVINLMLNPL